MPPKARTTRQIRHKAEGDGHEPKKDAEASHAEFEITSTDGKAIACQRYGTTTGSPRLVFTHGASGGLANPATRSFVQGYASDVSAICFKGSMNLQSRVKSFHAVIENQKSDTATLGGRSMGARAAVLAAKEHGTKTLVLVSYPLIGQNGATRDQILLDISADLDVLFVSGDKDSMCPLEQLATVRSKMKARTWLMVVKGADHGMSLTPKAAVDKIRECSGKAAAQWIENRDENLTECSLRWDVGGNSVVDDGWHRPPLPPASQSKSDKKSSRSDSKDDVEPAAKRRKKA